MTSDVEPLDNFDLLTEIVRALVVNPAAVTIEEISKNDFMIHVHPADVGKIIGKSGKTIYIIREIFYRIVALDGERISINVENPLAASGEVEMASC